MFGTKRNSAIILAIGSSFLISSCSSYKFKSLPWPTSVTVHDKEAVDFLREAPLVDDQLGDSLAYKDMDDDGKLVGLTEKSERDAFREEIRGLSGKEREDALTDRARFALARMGDFRFAPAITVDEEDADRCLYKLIFLSRHKKGIQVFRDAQRAALEIQSKNRSGRKWIKRATQSGMEDMFVDIEPVNPAERSAKEIQNGVNVGERHALDLIRGAGTMGISWGNLWPKVLEENVLTHSDLGNLIVAMRDSGQISIQGWKPRVRKPHDEYQLIASANTL